MACISLPYSCDETLTKKIVKILKIVVENCEETNGKSCNGWVVHEVINTSDHWRHWWQCYRDVITDRLVIATIPHQFLHTHTHTQTHTHTHTHTCRPVDGTSMNEECEAVKTTLWAEAPTAGWPPSLHSEIFNVRRRCAPSSHVSNEHTQNPMAGKIRDDWPSIPPLSFFTGRMPFLLPDQKRQSTQGKSIKVTYSTISYSTE